jgi:hypothetical protein
VVGESALALASCPFGLDLDGAGFAGGVMVEAAPAVVLGFGREASGDWVAVDVLNFFGSFFRRVDVEVVVASLPELLLASGFEFPEDNCLKI